MLKQINTICVVDTVTPCMNAMMGIFILALCVTCSNLNIYNNNQLEKAIVTI